MSLETYRKKRHFAKTPEPSGDDRPVDKIAPLVMETALSGGSSPEGRLYVIQKHAARRLHYDLRLELDGVLLSWAVPKGPSLNPDDKRLAARVEDHPLEYGSFEGTIPKGEYGAGAVELWDRGTWEPQGDAHRALAEGELKFALHGAKLKGGWVLVRMNTRSAQEGREEWLLIKHWDEYSVEGDGEVILAGQGRSVASGRSIEEITSEAGSSVWHGDQSPQAQTEVRPGEEFGLDPSRLKGARKSHELPRFLQPELATLVAEAPEGDEWLHEIKFDGYRALARLEKGTVQLLSRNQKDWTNPYQALAEDLKKLPVEGALLDGEVVVQMPDGTTSFQELQNVLGGSRRGNLLYHIFDLLFLEGYDLTRVPIEERKALLRRLLSRVGQDTRLRYTDDLRGNGAVFYERACSFGLEGMVSKKRGSPYRPGVRGSEWLKTKCFHRQEFVIGGYTDPAGTRLGFGALLLGAYEHDRLRYVGKVGTGFSDGLLKELAKRLRALEIAAPPFEEDPGRTPRGAHWVRPELVAEVAFAEWTREGIIRHPSFKGLREDKTAGEVTPEGAKLTGKVQAANTSQPNLDRERRGKKQPGSEGSVTKESAALAKRQRPRGGRGGPAAGADRPTVEETVQGVKLTHPDRVFWSTANVTKRDLVDYYVLVADRMLPYVLHRPVSMVRCPQGVAGVAPEFHQKQAGPCFFHKHAGPDFPGPFERIEVLESQGTDTYLTISSLGSLVALAQMGVLEIHIWGSRSPDIEHPDMIVFDLDPDPSVDWKRVVEGARLVRALLRGLGLESFVKTTGGKGLHVVAPIRPHEEWEAIRRFSKAIAEAVVECAPSRYTATMSKTKRQGKTFIDYVRNTRTATSIAPYSTRARERATVSVPLRWGELSGHVRPDSYTMKNVATRLRHLKGDPWEGYLDLQRSQAITGAMKAELGLG